MCVHGTRRKCGITTDMHCPCMFRATMGVLLVWSMSHHCTLQQELCWSLLQMYDSPMVTIG